MSVGYSARRAPAANCVKDGQPGVAPRPRERLHVCARVTAASGRGFMVCGPVTRMSIFANDRWEVIERMALHHASSGEVIDIEPLGSRVRDSQTTTLVKTDRLEILRLMLPAGKEIPAHKVAGPITVQCLEGRVELFAHDQWLPLAPGQLVYVEGHQSHALKGVEDASVLVTIQLRPESN